LFLLETFSNLENNMTKNRLLGVLAFGGLAAVISCDSGSSGTSSGLASNDCPIGTFRPVGIQDCVFPATDTNNQPLGVSDNRCAPGQPAVPPQCINDNGGRAYFSTSMTCAPGYRYIEGACDRTSGFAGSVGASTGFGTGFGTGTAGTTGFGTAGAGATGDFGEAGAGGFAAGDGTGFGGTTGSGGATSSDASTDARLTF
jgi:hypothetical protein